MKVSVCYKVNPDYDKVPAKDWMSAGIPDFSFTPQSIGYYDEGALESALCIKDELEKYDQKVELEAVTVGPTNDLYISQLYALGYDKVVVINGDDNTDEYSITKCAKILANYYSDNKPDMILFGKMAEPFESGELHYYLAKELDLSVIPNISQFKTSLKGELIINSQSKKLMEKYEYKKLFIGIVENPKNPYLRMYTLSAMNETKDKMPIQVSIMIDDNNSYSYSFEPVKNVGHHCEMIKPDANKLVKMITEA